MASTYDMIFENGRAALRQSYSYWKGQGLKNEEIAAKYNISLKTLRETLGYIVLDGKAVKAAKVYKEPKVSIVDEMLADILSDLGAA